MITVKFGGELADYFIDEFQCVATSAWEVLQAVKANFPKFIDYLRDSGARGIGFHVKVGYQTLKENEFGMQISKKIKSFTITPVPVGSGGGGLMKIILGVVLIGLAFTGVGFLGLSPLALGLTGGVMLLSGIMEMFGKTKSPNEDAKDNKKSIVFNGPQTTVTEGGRIPVVYGIHLTGWSVVSARVRSFKV